MVNGLERLRKLTQPFPLNHAVKEWRKKGNKVMGWLCTYVPEEILYAASILPIRITGDSQELALDKANTYLYTNTCSMSRSCLELVLRDEYNFLDGLVAGATCDGARRLFDIWKLYHPHPFMYILTVPRKYTPAACSLFEEEIMIFKDRLETYLHKAISLPAIDRAIEICNRTRYLLRQLYQMRMDESVPISGAETLEIVNASTRMPKEIFNPILEEIITELSEFKGAYQDSVRLMLCGSMLNNPEFIRGVEELGAVVVTDELCSGPGYFWEDVDTQLPTFRALAKRYLENFPCARMDPVDQRFDKVLAMIKESNVQGVINQIIRFCVPYGHDAPFFKRILEAEGIPVLDLDVEYGVGKTGQIKTRVQAFIEMIKNRQ